MRMKRLCAFVLTIVIVMSLCGCGNKSAIKVSEKSLYEHGLDVVSLMVEAARSESYLQVYTGSDELLEIVKTIGEGEFTVPKVVYAVKLPVKMLWELTDYIKMGDLSEELTNALNGKMLGALVTRINALSGANYLAATSVCTMGKTFVKSDLTEDVIYIYVYEDATPVAITFTVGEGGAVSASGTFIIHDEFTCGSAEEIKDFLGGGEVTEVTME